MDKATRIYKLHRLLAGRLTGVTLERIMEELECSRATASRVIGEMRDEFMAPLVFDWERGGYRLEPIEGPQELPGVWFNEKELLALLTMQQLLSQMGSRYITRLLSPIQDRIQSMLGGESGDSGSISGRVRVYQHMGRRSRSAVFESVAAATLGKQKTRPRRMKMFHP
jgi:predicted DNA-binding transcriptional regulator YafY